MNHREGEKREEKLEQFHVPQLSDQLNQQSQRQHKVTSGDLREFYQQ